MINLCESIGPGQDLTYHADPDLINFIKTSLCSTQLRMKFYHAHVKMPTIFLLTF